MMSASETKTVAKSEAPAKPANPANEEYLFTSALLWLPRRIGGLFSSAENKIDAAVQLREDIAKFEETVGPKTIKLNGLIKFQSKTPEILNEVCDISIGIANELDKTIQLMKIQIEKARSLDPVMQKIVIGVFLQIAVHIPSLVADMLKDSASNKDATDRKLSLDIHDDVNKTEKLVNDIVGNLQVALGYVTGTPNPSNATPKGESAGDQPSSNPLEQIEAELDGFRNSLAALKLQFNQAKKDIQLKQGQIKPIGKAKPDPLKIIVTPPEVKVDEQKSPAKSTTAVLAPMLKARPDSPKTLSDLFEPETSLEDNRFGWSEWSSSVGQTDLSPTAATSPKMFNPGVGFNPLHSENSNTEPKLPLLRSTSR